MIISKIANSNFFAINTMLTFHKHPLLSQTKHCMLVNIKDGHNRRCKPPLRSLTFIGLLRHIYYTSFFVIFQYISTKLIIFVIIISLPMQALISVSTHLLFHSHISSILSISLTRLFYSLFLKFNHTDSQQDYDIHEYLRNRMNILS